MPLSRQDCPSMPYRRALLACACAALTACSPFGAPPPALTPAPAAGAATMAAPAWQQRGMRLLHIAPQESLLTITVRRGGALARLGHDHVVASRSLQGVVAPRAGRAAFQFRLDEMSVDEDGLRQAAGLTTTPSADAIAGTRHNMLVRVLEAERYPWVRVDARRIDARRVDARRSEAGGEGNMALLDADITLHGVTRAVQLPVRIEEAADGRSLQASGSLLLKQSDFGIVPFAILGGAMAVQDQMELAFRITARADLSAPGSGAGPGR
ncbi:YceI family protein [Janthinobacterium sp.]|uniref:YceI family protein n=1 Tax=Janthinobacterium sp. TaxID=1871054 RepID=UPI0025C5D126|nr:YceI family protein [Janthinobacterium sp.]